MENKKTLVHLNSKWWYRLIKVFYILMFVIILIVPTITIFNGFKPNFNAENSYIKCNDGQTVNLLQNKIYLYSEYIYTDDDNKIRNLCLSDSEIGGVAKQVYPNGVSSDGVKYTNFSDIELGKSVREANSVWILKMTPTEKNYELVAVYDERNWLAIIGFSFISIILVIFVFELIKRIFYYVALGTIKPEK